ncbi:MAG: ROK family protein [Bacteroidetes bacterium]|nr:ROK family protein [Bacteroidota bacterium]MCY4206298.1 ROK family protein [Bacteroidota bacterium]
MHFNLEVLGIDIGGTGIKGAPVIIETGEISSKRFRLPTPKKGLPQDIAETVHAVSKHFSWDGKIGITLPVRIRNGIACTAANIDQSWIGTNVNKLFSKVLESEVTTLNDADAAGYAETHYGAGKGAKGKTLVLTLGTGIGSSLFMNSLLIPNLELGHLRMYGTTAEILAANSTRKRDHLSWETWADRLQDYLTYIEFLLDPDLIILGGGISRPKRTKHYFHLLKTQARLLPAHFQNEAGIIGAACAAHNQADR